MDFGTQHEEVRKGWVKEAKGMIIIARNLKIKFLNFHFYPGNGSSKKIVVGRRAFIANFTESMKELAAFATA